MSSRLTGAMLIALSAAAFGSMAIFGVWAHDDGIDTPALILVRFALASLVLVGVMRVRGVALPPLRRCAPVAAMGGIGYVGQSYCYFLALEHAQASLVALLLYLFPAFVAVLAAVFLRERISAVTAGALVLALAGTALVVGGGTGRPLGIVLGIGAAVVYSIYITVGSVVTGGMDVVAVATIVCVAATGVCGTIVLILWATGRPPAFPSSATGWADLLAIAVICTVVAILAFFAGLALLGPTSASVLSTLEPVVTVALATWLLQETLSGVQLVGGVLVLGAVAWLALSHRGPVESAPPGLRLRPGRD
ncbi:DMT family transporter [Aeromicrobium chenweiae]|uniref:EamA family transporter n=1 Tax=Aeromicrobium chenweiae TaxID=2079793 RepID=A0A2S0WPL8_9ACTN|nr:DMT family transporter [Aeromicrobium chenweiae]AWB93285.1 EamA family transporter [Aeromicrobium chenweiae]TGN34278.1 DMT family transporter [Aeromicrobium chenweiae]